MINETAWMAGDALHYAPKLNAKRHVYRLSLLQFCFFLFYYLCKCIKPNGKKLKHSKTWGVMEFFLVQTQFLMLIQHWAPCTFGWRDVLSCSKGQGSYLLPPAHLWC